LRSAAPITIYGTGEQRRDFVHVSDIATAILDLASSQRVGVWNVGTGVAVSINELVRALEVAFGRAATVTRQASRVGDVFSSRLIVDRIEGDFGWRPATSLASGIRALVLDVTPSNT
jgi:nucleoside-diphosphate-sugar epimerase